MATLKQAEAARSAHAERLRRLGAHAVEVKKVTRQGKKTFVVVASFERRPQSRVPSTVTVTSGGKRVNVEVVAKIAPEFRPD